MSGKTGLGVCGCCPYSCVVLDGQDWSGKNIMVLVLVFSMQSSSWLLCLERVPLTKFIISLLQLETDCELGTNKGISDKQLQLKTCCPHVLSITMVDLFGITTVTSH
jgi:hypothetical protein